MRIVMTSALPVCARRFVYGRFASSASSGVSLSFSTSSWLCLGLLLSWSASEEGIAAATPPNSDIKATVNVKRLVILIPYARGPYHRALSEDSGEGQLANGDGDAA